MVDSTFQNIDLYMLRHSATMMYVSIIGPTRDKISLTKNWNEAMYFPSRPVAEAQADLLMKANLGHYQVVSSQLELQIVGNR